MNKLRFILFLLIGLVCAVNFCSCDHEPEYCESIQLEINKYLYNNYEIGDTIIFLKDSCINDSFIVNTNKSGAHTHRYLDRLTKHILYDTLYIENRLKIYNKEFILEVDIYQETYYSDSITGIVDIYSNNQPHKIPYEYISSQEIPVEFTITNSLGHSAHLRKGEGVVDFSDGEHTWVLKNNNDSIGNSVHLRKGEAIIDSSTDEHTWTKKRKIET